MRLLLVNLVRFCAVHDQVHIGGRTTEHLGDGCGGRVDLVLLLLRLRFELSDRVSEGGDLGLLHSELAFSLLLLGLVGGDLLLEGSELLLLIGDVLLLGILLIFGQTFSVAGF